MWLRQRFPSKFQFFPNTCSVWLHTLDTIFQRQWNTQYRVISHPSAKRLGCPSLAEVLVRFHDSRHAQFSAAWTVLLEINCEWNFCFLHRWDVFKVFPRFRFMANFHTEIKREYNTRVLSFYEKKCRDFSNGLKVSPSFIKIPFPFWCRQWKKLFLFVNSTQKNEEASVHDKNRMKNERELLLRIHGILKLIRLSTAAFTTQ